MSENSESNIFETQLWKTIGSRFNAYRRTARKHTILTYITTISSIHILLIGIFQLSTIVELTTKQSQILSLISISTAIIILCYGLIEGGKNYGLQSENYHLCGKDLNKIYSKLKNINAKERTGKLEVLTTEYSHILDKYTLNHTAVDYKYFLIQHPKDFPEYANKYSIKALTALFNYQVIDLFFAALFILLPLSLTILTFTS